MLALLRAAADTDADAVSLRINTVVMFFLVASHNEYMRFRMMEMATIQSAQRD